MSRTTYRELSPEDSARIGCQTSSTFGGCDSPATVCHVVEWHVHRPGVSFFYFCADCHAAQVTRAAAGVNS